MSDQSKPKLEWEVLEVRQIENSLDPTMSQAIEVSRARIHQGWLVLTVVYTGERVLNVSVASVRDENYEWDKDSHRE